MNGNISPISTTTVYSLDGERFIFTSVRAVLQELADTGNLKMGVVFHAAERIPCQAAAYLDVEWILVEADAEAYLQIGKSFNNDFTRVGEEAREELKALLAGWVEKHVVTDYWRFVGNSRKVHVTKQDLLGYQESLDAAQGALER